ncbi:glycerophosphocholine cholinephosphodiesterase ENPP6-like [Oppia nitens]|uniref:glycerophosphocholine cholinephosphodiesterase ENPP6-like n=1 Tax=Oppia nitens TaxID=1686743 RepID=UPI0023DBD02D|nr:glycerophosphocholine cholinephosphodiesterase ENPP6-like [Oppia nitens]
MKIEFILTICLLINILLAISGGVNSLPSDRRPLIERFKRFSDGDDVDIVGDDNNDDNNGDEDTTTASVITTDNNNSNNDDKDDDDDGKPDKDDNNGNNSDDNDEDDEDVHQEEDNDDDDSQPDVSQEGSKLLVILVDGFRWDYVARDKRLIGFPRVAANGVTAKYVKPVFPANSYPNWYSIMTGLYPESHGMFENYMYDQDWDELFLMSPHRNASHSHWWNQTEPLWVTAEQNGCRTAMYLWDGCQVRIRGTKPYVCHQYRQLYSADEADNQTRTYMKQILDDFSYNKYRLALLYYEFVDYNGHEYGPRHRRTKQAIRAIDKIINDLYDDILEEKLEDDVNVVIVSDHGMISKEGFRVIDIEDYLDFNDVELFIGKGSVAQVLPEKDKEDEVFHQLRQAKVDGLNVYRKANIPDRYHMKNHKNVLPILLTTDEGYYIEPPTIKDKVYPHQESDTAPGDDSDDDNDNNDNNNVLKGGGAHGYDVEYVDEMRTIVYGFGPAFRKAYISEPLEMVDHYNLFCELLDLNNCRPNNGSKYRTELLLKEAESDDDDDNDDSDEDDDEDNDGDDDDSDGDGVQAFSLNWCLVFAVLAKIGAQLWL